CLKAKEDFLDKLDNNYNNHLDLYYACIEDYFDLHPALRKAYQAQMAPYKDAIEKAKSDLEGFYLALLDQPPVYQQLFEELKSTHQKYKSFTSQKLKTSLKGDSQACMNAFTATLNTILPILQAQPSYLPLANALAQAQQARDQVQHTYYTA